MAKLIVTGDKKIDKMIKRLADPKNSNKVLRTSMRKAMKPLADQVKSNAPVLSGDFRKAIKIKAGKRTKSGFSIRVILSDAELRKSRPELIGKSGAFYAAAVEWGDADQEGTAPFRRAFDAGKESVRSNAMTLIKAGILALRK